MMSVQTEQARTMLPCWTGIKVSIVFTARQCNSKQVTLFFTHLINFPFVFHFYLPVKCNLKWSCLASSYSKGLLLLFHQHNGNNTCLINCVIKWLKSRFTLFKQTSTHLIKPLDWVDFIRVPWESVSESNCGEPAGRDRVEIFSPHI